MYVPILTGSIDYLGNGIEMQFWQMGEQYCSFAGIYAWGKRDDIFWTVDRRYHEYLASIYLRYSNSRYMIVRVKPELVVRNGLVCYRVDNLINH